VDIKLRFNYSDGTHFGRSVSIRSPLLKKRQLHSTFEKMSQLDLFQTKITNVVNGMPHVIMWFF